MKVPRKFFDILVEKDRFTRHDISNHEKDPIKTGMLPNETEWLLGTPDVNRNETITLIGATTHTSERLLLTIKWRPSEPVESNVCRLVTCVSELQFTTKSGQTLKYEQIESYTPQAEANLTNGAASERKFIQQYGSSGSKLKLLVLNPYRRTRLVFSGHMELVGGEKSEKRFVKLSCVLTPCGQIFDFLAKSTKFHSTGSAKSSPAQLDQLALHDRHEQRVRYDGEISIFASDGLAPERNNFTLRGFHIRHFLELDAQKDANCKTARLYVALQIGKAFSLGVSWREEQPNGVSSSTEVGLEAGQLCFGYTQFKLQPTTRTILDFEGINFDLVKNKQSLLKEFLIVHSQQNDEYLGCQLSESDDKQSADWLLAEGSPAMSEKERLEKCGQSKIKGWALLTYDDGIVDSAQTIERIEKNRNEQMQAIASGSSIGGKNLDIAIAKELLVVSIDDHLCASSELVGSKAASLAQLLELRNKFPSVGYHVPHAIVLTRFAWDLLEQENESLLRPLLDELVSAVITGATQSIGDKCESLRKVIGEQMSLPKSIKEQLLDKLKCRDVKSGMRFAVRSSSWGEDEADMSAAGQLTTVLNVEFEPADESLKNISEAILTCFASKFSYENIQYKSQHGLPLDLPMAVVIQEMVSCEKAGVMFTCDPVTGDESRLTITANFGLGESVVSAQADPDSIRVGVDLDLEAVDEGKAVSIKEVHIGKKEVIIGGSGEQQQQQQQAAGSQDRSKCCLSDDEILQLARVGRRLKKYYSSQQVHCDIEFGYLEGQLNLFQCRPVTGLEQWSEAESLHEFTRTPPTELNFYCRANVGEVLPYAQRPLTQTFVTTGIWNVLMPQMALDYQPYKNALHMEDIYIPQCAQADMPCEKYHIFFNLFATSFLQLSVAGKKDAIALALEIGMFGREVEEQRDLIEAARSFKPEPNPFVGLRFELKSWRMRLNPIGHIDGVKARIDRKYKALKKELDELKQEAQYEWEEDAKRVKLLGVYAKLADTMKESFICWNIHMVATMRSGESNMEVMKLFSKYIQDPVQLSTASNKLLALSKDVISAEIPARIGEIAEQIKKQQAPEVEAETFLAKSDDEALEYLMKQAKFIEFLDKFGHRCYHEFDVGSARWDEEPERLLEMVRANLRSPAVEEEGDKKKKTKKPAFGSLDEVLESHNLLGKLSSFDYYQLKYRLVPRSQLYLAARERTKNCLIQFMACLRLCFRQLGRELHQQLRLPDEQLVMFLPFDELEPLCRGSRPAVVAQALRRRQLFKRLFPPDNSSEAWKFDEIIRELDIVPNHLKPNRELDEHLMKAPKLIGTPASSGKIRARVCLVKNYQELGRVKPGSILLTHSTDIAFSPVFPLVSGIITEVGGLISHGAVVAREYGLPCVIGIPEVTRILQDEEEILLDADAGTIIRLSAAKEATSEGESNGNSAQETTTAAAAAAATS